MNRLAKWLPRLILVVAFVTILPVGKMVWGVRWYNGRPNIKIITARELTEVDRVCQETIAAAKAKGSSYKAREYVVDCHRLFPVLEKLQLRKPNSVYDKHIETLCDLAQANYDPQMNPMGFHRDFNTAYSELGDPLSGYRPPNDSESSYWLGGMLLSLVIWYLKFIPFALMLILLQIESRKDQIRLRDELGHWRNFLSYVIFWPVGLMNYGDENYCGVVMYRYFNLKARYVMIKRGDSFTYDLSSDEKAMLWAEAQKSDDYIAQVARLAQVSREVIKQQSVAAIWASAALSFIAFFFTAGRVLAATKESMSVSIVAAKGKGEELRVFKKSPEPSPTPTTEPNHQFPNRLLQAVLPIGPINFGPAGNPCVVTYRIRPPPEPTFPIDHVPW